ncbi:Glutathione synthetase, partial [Stegodyphus mimosarum]
MYGLNSETLASAAEDAKDYAISRGIAMHPSDLTKDARVPLPFCLFPSPFPENWFTFVYELQPHLNLILHKIAHSRMFLKECLSSIIEADEFTRKIFEIFEAVDYEREKKV